MPSQPGILGDTCRQPCAISHLIPGRRRTRVLLVPCPSPVVIAAHAARISVCRKSGRSSLGKAIPGSGRRKRAFQFKGSSRLVTCAVGGPGRPTAHKQLCLTE